MNMNFRDWLKYEADEEKIKKVFYNASIAMKYIHSHDHYVENFNPTEIEIMDIEKLSPIKFNNLDTMTLGNEEAVIRSNIYTEALLQIAAYTNTIDSINPRFVKENFSEFEMFLPEEDVPYLRGIIERHSAVYYCDYINEKRKREIDKMVSETEGLSGNSYGRVKNKSTAVGRAMADTETKRLYSGLDEKQSAFVNFMFLPVAMIILGVIASIITMFIK